MASIFAMGYLGIGVSDLDTWSSFATDVLGMTVAPAEDDPENSRLLRMDDRAWRFRLEKGEDGSMPFLGLEVVNRKELEELATSLEQNGVVVKEDSELAKIRQVNGLISVMDPGGNSLEIFHGARSQKQPFVSPTGARFVTGRLGFGHVVIAFEEFEEAKHFYMDLLGFRLSDTIGETHFTHVNGRHHSIGIGHAGINGRPGGLGHFMVQVEDLDMVGRALDKVLDGGAPLTSTFGRHTNDHMLSFYCLSPSGLRIEYGTGGRLVDDANWYTTNYDYASYWGHKRPVPQDA